MKLETTHALIWTFFCFCLGCGLFGRWESVRHVREAAPGQSVNLSNDEIVFLTLGKNLRSDWSHYNVREWYEQERAAGRAPPDYLGRPLFKHPPLMAAIVAAVAAPGIEGTRNAFMLMLGAGILTCAAVYGLARCLLSPMWSLVAAAIAWIDPVLWGGSVKVWLDLPLALFCTAALGCAWLGRSRPASFLAMGFFFGLAFLTKYPSFVLWAAATVLIWRDPSVRKGRCLIWGCVIPWMMLLPWLGWNLHVYGGSALDFDESRHAVRLFEARIWVVVAAAAAALLLVWVGKDSGRTRKAPKLRDDFGRPMLLAMLILTSAGLLLFHSWFSGRMEPRAGMTVNFFSGDPAWFYLDRLLSLDPLLWPGVVALFWVRLPPPAEFLRWTALAVGLVFSVWGNYQSRYMMPAIPLVCVLSAWGLFQITAYLSKPGAMWLEKAWLCSWLLFAAVRLGWIHQKLTLPNQFTYF